MERTARIATGESVAFSYELAGVGSRFFAVFVDMALQVAVALALVALLSLVVRTAPHAAPEKFGGAVLTALFVLAGFMLFFGYFIVFEWRWQGRTPGKRLVGLRVVRDGGFPLDFTSSVIRNVVRLVEVALGFYAVAAVAALLSPQSRRLGDMAAGTIVIRDNRFERATLPPVGEDREDDPLVARLSQEQRDLVRSYALRRPSLAPVHRLAIAADIAASVRPRLSIAFEHLDDDDLLAHLAATALGPPPSRR